jgi:hypothetical protein
MSEFARIRARAGRAFARQGAAVEFAREDLGAHDPLTGTFTPLSAPHVTGTAVSKIGDPEVYEDLGLKRRDAITLLFWPDSQDDVIRAGDSVEWRDDVYIVREAEPVGPDGAPVMWEVVASR